MLPSLAGCEYFPFVFGVLDGKLVIELIICEGNKVVTVSSMQKENKLTSADWNVIYFSLASAIKYIVHNDLKSDDFLLKLRNNVWIPKLADMGKLTLKSNPETYKLSNTQRDCYNKIYPRLAFVGKECLRNVLGTKTSVSSDIFSFGYIFKHLYPSSPILQMLTSKKLVRDPKKRVAILCGYNTVPSCMDVVQKKAY